MGKDLNGIAEELSENSKKVQLVYAFNGTGKTRLSKEFISLIKSKSDDNGEKVDNRKVLYYNAFTEDLIYWNNDLENNLEPKLIIQPNDFTKWILLEQGKDKEVIECFQNYTSEKLSPKFNDNFTEVTFSFQRGNDETHENIKISKGEESCFIWSVFYSMFEQVVEVLNIDKDSINEERDTEQFDELEYVFIDDPVSSLDDNHLIEMAVNISELIKSSISDLKFIITTHNPLFYNVLYNEIGNKESYMLERLDDFTFHLEKKSGDSNRSFFYHLHLKNVLQKAIEADSIEKYHFVLLRNLYEKTASFLGYKHWSDLLPGDKEKYHARIINFTSHSTIANESMADPTPQEKQTVKFLLEHLVDNYGFKGENNNG